MLRDDLIRLRHMLEASDSAIQFASGRSRSDLDTDAMLRFALTYAVQVVGEAASKVSAAGRAAAPEIDWAVMVAMRNRLVHAYADVNRDILWTTVTASLPALRQQLRAVEGIDSESGEDS